uniref:WKF domain-containing protein n=1 Tax=Clastoptera arizonana TaxID=38151 RepID=A0A1B6C669_9HEMI
MKRKTEEVVSNGNKKLRKTSFNDSKETQIYSKNNKIELENTVEHNRSDSINQHNKYEKKHKKQLENNNDVGNEKTVHADFEIKKTKKTRRVQFQESVEISKILEDGSSKMKVKKLKGDMTNNSNTINMISEINSQDKGNKKKKSKKEKKMEKLLEDSKQVHQQSMEYLRKWKNDYSNWKFEKAKQLRLLNYMFDRLKLSDEMFSIFLEYISGSKGNIKNIINDKCSKIIGEVENSMNQNKNEESDTNKNEESDTNKNEESDTKKLDTIKYERARALLQLI